jgi:hypothetical protein
MISALSLPLILKYLVAGANIHEPNHAVTVLEK